MSKTRRFLLATFGFTQAVTFPDVSRAQNVFEDEFCQFEGTMCFDNGCSAQGGQCVPTQAVDPTGQEIQGCICSRPPDPQPLCKRVFDHLGNVFCADFGCPPYAAYNCDPVDCVCRRTIEWGDDFCQVDLGNPTQCADNGCAAQGGWCDTEMVKLPDGQDYLACHCTLTVIPHPTDCVTLHNDYTGAAACADFDCGNVDFYECNPDPANCFCLCGSTIPPEIGNLRWPSKLLHDWDPVPCATVYNVYREIQPLLNCGGVACSYGTCYWSGLVATNASEVADPPVGQAYFYLVTAETVAGEGTMGNSSAGLTRPNYFPCPTPPPPPP